jgi:hypothetical protein
VFDPSGIRYQFLHVFFLVVRHDVSESGKKGYRAVVTNNREVPPFGPSLPPGSGFYDKAEFREFMMGERVSSVIDR